jgi:hypothetical protein
VALHVLRVWVPDRPGALGAVASRIGAVRGDLVGIEILERGGGRAIDELVIDLPDAEIVDLLVSEVSEVDGVDVEDVRRVDDGVVDPRLDALETAAELVAHDSVPLLLQAFAAACGRDFRADWVAVTGQGSTDRTVVVGPAPGESWLDAFLIGSEASAAAPSGDGGPHDVAWARLTASGLAVVLGRAGRPWHLKERRQLDALARIVDSRWAQLSTPLSTAP